MSQNYNTNKDGATLRNNIINTALTPNNDYIGDLCVYLYQSNLSYLLFCVGTLSTACWLYRGAPL